MEKNFGEREKQENMELLQKVREKQENMELLQKLFTSRSKKSSLQDLEQEKQAFNQSKNKLHTYKRIQPYLFLGKNLSLDIKNNIACITLC